MHIVNIDVTKAASTQMGEMHGVTGGGGGAINSLGSGGIGRRQGSGKLLVDKSKSCGQFWSKTTRKASGQIVSGQ